MRRRDFRILWRHHKQKLLIPGALILLSLVMLREPPHEKPEVLVSAPEYHSSEAEKFFLHQEAMDTLAAEMKMRPPVYPPKRRRK